MKQMIKRGIAFILVISMMMQVSHIDNYRYIDEVFATSVNEEGVEEEVTEEELRSSPVIYYLINTLTHEIFGPFDSKENFDIICESLETGAFCDWIIVDPNRPLRQSKTE